MSIMNMMILAAGWLVFFNEPAQRLELKHAESGAVVSGKVAFVGPDAVTGAGVGRDATTADWRVADSRDGFKDRLALVDTRNNVNGYVTFQQTGDEISLLVYHRTAFAFKGTFTFDYTVKYRQDAFCCRLTPKAGDRVLSIRSGAAVSKHDDAWFSPAADEALQTVGAKTLAIDDPAANTLVFRIVRDYYKSRWVPGYRPLDRKRAPHAPTGWLSWNTYFDQAGSKENLDEARFAAKWFKPFGMQVWNIESWQDNSDKLPVSKFYNMNLETYAKQFPEGMKWLADEIRKLGFTPGLWMAPYGTGNREFYEQHKDWFLHNEKGEPISCWNGKYTLDPTAPGALEHLRDVFDRASHEWGYEFFKIDGMSGRGAGYCAHMYERPEIKARMHDPKCPNPFELTCKAWRDGIGEDRVFLACQGHFTGAESAYADCSRTGADIVHPNQPVKWANLLLQARCTINQFFAHSVVFWSDPDCMLVSKDLEREQAEVEATIVSLPGQQTFAGDHLAELAPDRVKLIQQALPVCDTHPGNLYPQFGYLPVWDLHVQRDFGDWHVVALFNWDETEKEVAVTWDELGEPADAKFLAYEYWTKEYLGEKTGSVARQVPAHGVRIVTLRRAAGRPQLVSTDRHITQGGVELKGESWDAQAKTLTLKLDAVAGFPYEVAVVGPDGLRKATVASDKNETVEIRLEY